MEKSHSTSPTCCCQKQLGSAAVQSPTSGELDLSRIPTVSTKLNWVDRLSAWKMRWGIGRDRYRITPGLYAVGHPTKEDVVLVSSNYKLSFDALRKELAHINTWILVLDTKGINVWCAAGKGTFGTGELVRQIVATDLAQVVSHRTLILPQLSASGVSGFEVKRQSGFTVVFGPIRAADIKSFLDRGMKADSRMRRMTFPLVDRMKVVPVELVSAMKYFLIYAVLVALWLFARSALTAGRLSNDLFPVLGAILIGTVAVPFLLPWIPFRSFTLKGWLVGFLWAIFLGYIQRTGIPMLIGNVLLLPAISAFLALNFTGSTTFTSQNGVNKEIRIFARPMAITALAGILLIIIGR